MEKFKGCKECRHIKDDGEKCHSPAMRGSAFCYFHGRIRRRKIRTTAAGDVRLDISPLTDRAAIVDALGQVLNELANARITPRRANAMLLAIQMAQK